jgi:hypothetical protein
LLDEVASGLVLCFPGSSELPLQATVAAHSGRCGRAGTVRPQCGAAQSGAYAHQSSPPFRHGVRAHSGGRHLPWQGLVTWEWWGSELGRGFGIEVAQQMPTAVQVGPIQRGSGGRSASAVIHMCKRGPRGAVCTPRASGTGLD